MGRLQHLGSGKEKDAKDEFIVDVKMGMNENKFMVDSTGPVSSVDKESALRLTKKAKARKSAFSESELKERYSDFNGNVVKSQSRYNTNLQKNPDLVDSP